ncbi:hypothetical protein BJ912DRAFT_929182 [Pholiota molesta]|nr:hypothetical protein BJ912DRAFT_929182 [Pholiota molesta]
MKGLHDDQHSTSPAPTPPPYTLESESRPSITTTRPSAEPFASAFPLSTTTMEQNAPDACAGRCRESADIRHPESDGLGRRRRSAIDSWRTTFALDDPLDGLLGDTGSWLKSGGTTSRGVSWYVSLICSPPREDDDDAPSTARGSLWRERSTLDDRERRLTSTRTTSRGFKISDGPDLRPRRRRPCAFLPRRTACPRGSNIPKVDMRDGGRPVDAVQHTRHEHGTGEGMSLATYTASNRAMEMGSRASVPSGGCGHSGAHLLRAGSSRATSPSRASANAVAGTNEIKWVPDNTKSGSRLAANSNGVRVLQSRRPPTTTRSDIAAEDNNAGGPPLLPPPSFPPSTTTAIRSDGWPWGMYKT